MQANCLHVCLYDNTVAAAAELAGAFVFGAQQKLFNLLDIREGDDAAGDSSPSQGGLGEGGGCIECS